jgi:hypothetical protein
VYCADKVQISYEHVCRPPVFIVDVELFKPGKAFLPYPLDLCAKRKETLPHLFPGPTLSFRGISFGINQDISKFYKL